MQKQKPHYFIEYLHPRSLKYLSDSLNTLVKGRLWLKVLIAMALGIVTGILMGPSVGWLDPVTALVVGSWLAFPGQLFLALVQMIVIPLVFTSVALGLTAGESIEQLKKMGLWAALFFIFFTAVATAIGLIIGMLIAPGHYISSELVQASLGAGVVVPASSELTPPTLAELPGKLVVLLPSNPLTSMVEGQMLQVLLFAIIFGLALLMMLPAKARPMLEVLSSLQEICMTVVRWAMLLAPFAVFGLMAQLTTKIGLEALLGMAIYVATVLLGLLLLLVLYLMVVLFVARENPLHFLRDVREVMLLAFSTSSSAAVMPLSIKIAEEKLGIRSSISQFVIPLGATINMNGTALYQGVAAIFLAQVFGVDIGVAGMALIVLMAVGASIGSPATPGVGIVILAMVLETVGIPAAGIALIMGVDRILDMSRTAINVCGDLVASRVLESRERMRPSKASPARTPAY